MKMNKKTIRRIFGRLIAEGGHAVIQASRGGLTVMPLTELGYAAIRQALIDAHAPQRFVDGLARKRFGHYVAAVPLKDDPDRVALLLQEQYGLPEGSVLVLTTEEEITTLGLDEFLH